jgi:high affinity Mn2+ porin
MSMGRRWKSPSGDGNPWLAAVLTSAALGAPVTAALAADAALPTKAPAGPEYNWEGAYFGGHVGYGRGTTDAVLDEPTVSPFRHRFGSLYAGVQAGYNLTLPSHLLLGIEGDVTFPNYLQPDNVAWLGVTNTSGIIETIDYVATLRARLGYRAGNMLPYVTGGFAWSNSHVAQQPFDSDTEFSHPHLRTGAAAGAGIEVGFAPGWSARTEYLYARFGDLHAALFPTGQYASRLDFHTLRIGLNHQFGAPAGGGEKDDKGEQDDIKFPTWEMHAQTTFIYQGYPRFPALYTGTNSLTPGPQAKETLTTTAFVGLRLWNGGELYYSPELSQGFGLSDTVGAGGFPNGEAQKSNFPYPRYNTARLFLRQTFGLGGEQEDVESGPNQLSGKIDVARLTVQFGKFSVKDVFDGNSYCSDARVHFLNWAIWAAGAFDYPADKVGYAYGTTAELNAKDWALRAGYFLVPATSNSNDFDAAVFRRGGYMVELENRYTLAGQPGKLRTIGWVNSTFSGDYRDALVIAATTGLDPTDAIVADRAGRIKYGYAFNVEQAVTDQVGLFGRWSWNDGHNEIMSFTDIDASLSGGTTIKGKGWGRPNDTFGLAGAINALSRDHRDYLAAGGLGLLIGDGRLNYRHEQILETFYALGLAKDVTLTFDYQFLVNPAYNADRGPVHVFTGRLHAEM